MLDSFLMGRTGDLHAMASVIFVENEYFVVATMHTHRNLTAATHGFEDGSLEGNGLTGGLVASGAESVGFLIPALQGDGGLPGRGHVLLDRQKLEAKAGGSS